MDGADVTTRAAAHRAFEQLAGPFRREIRLHCYRMMGSLHEAEDLAQETYLRAWRSRDGFKGGSLRAWLYRIATNACLNALEARQRHAGRLLPDQLGPPSAASPPGDPATDVAWLEPFPDSGLAGIEDAGPTPESRTSLRESVRLAFVAAIQRLPARQRAALLLCDVLGWSAAEAAALLDGSTASVNSALQRARGALAAPVPGGRPREAPPPSPEQERLLARYLRAWEAHDAAGLGALLREDASAVMPPWPRWYAGREAIRAFFAEQWRTCRGLRLVSTAANGQPAFAVYERGADGRFAAHSIHVLTLEGEAIAGMALFLEPRLVEAFGLPPVLPDAGA